MKAKDYVHRVGDQRTSKPVINQKMARVEPRSGKHSPGPTKPMPAKKSGRRG